MSNRGIIGGGGGSNQNATQQISVRPGPSTDGLAFPPRYGLLEPPLAPSASTHNVLDASAGIGPPGFTEVRASSATYFDSSGILRTALSNNERVDWNPATLALSGLLIEDTSTNNTDTNIFTDSVKWEARQITVGSAVVGPDGALSAYAVIPDSNNAFHDFTNTIYATTNPITCSLYVKANGYSQVAIREGAVSGASAVFSLASGGSVAGTYNAGAYTTSNATITDVGGGWFRISVTFYAGGTNQNFRMSTVILNGTWTTGDPLGISFVGSGSSILFALPQQELFSGTPTSYIYTTGVTATRAADAYSFTLAGGATALTFTFDDGSTQTVSGLTGGATYNIPTNLNRPWILYIDDNTAAVSNVGAAAGTSTILGVGASLDNSIAAAAGTSTVLGVGAALGIGVGSAAGTSTVTATGAALGIGVGSSAGTSTATATGAALGKGVGNAAGTSTVLATGQSSVASVGASAGVSTVSGVGAALAASIGSAAGTSTDAATGASLAKGVGNAAGIGTALGVSGTVAAAAGTSTVTGVGSALFKAVGAAAGTSTVTATGVGAAFAVGVSSGTSTVSGIGKSLAVAIGSAAGFGTASGLSPSQIMQAVGLATGNSIVVGVGNAHRPGTWQIAVRGKMDVQTPWKIGNTAIDTIPTVPGAQSIYSDSTPDIYQVGDIYSQTAQNTWKVATRGNMDVQTAWKIAR